MRIKKLVINLLLMVLVSAGQSFAESNSGVSAGAKLTELLGGIQTFRADFKQRILDDRGDSIQQLDGIIALKRPGLIYWKTNAPLEQLVVSDGVQLWVYDPDLEQVTVQQLDQRITQTPALLLSGNLDSLEASYQVSGEQKNSLWHFSLIPKDPESLFEQLKLVFSENQLLQMHISDSLGQTSILDFLGAETNISLDSALFEFKPPQGVDVITQ